MIDWFKYQLPFPHLVGYWDRGSTALDEVARDFPSVDWPGWHRFENDKERKLTCETWQGPATQSLADFISSQSFIADVADRLEIKGSISASFVGGGYHLIPVGGYLGMHVDFNLLCEGLYRRANVLVYLNRNWGADDGGCLRLGNQGGALIRPELGNVVAFPTTRSSWHGHPDPTRRIRKSFAVYIYSDQPPADYQGEAHSTIFQS